MNLFNKRIKKVNDILGSQNFYPFLCDFSNNDIATVIDNLSKLINYILTTDSNIDEYGYEVLLPIASLYTKEGDFLIYGTNSYLDNIIKLTGLNPRSSITGFNKDLTILDNTLSFLSENHYNYFPLYGSVKKAIEEGFSHPKSVYKGILKQPSTDKRPVVVGETETQYYNSILQNRLKNLPDDYRKTGTAIAKRVLKEIIGKGITLYFIPPDKYLEHDVLTERVLPFNLKSIKIPSLYTLIIQCAKNKRLNDGTKLSLDTGEPYIRPEPKIHQYSSLEYYDYERVFVNDKFQYDNNELSGDLSYDLDTLYTRLDPKHDRDLFGETTLDERLRKIVNSYDYSLVLRDGKYHISNGRHRILFLKHYYEQNLPDCTKPSHLEYLTNQTTIIGMVNHTIEDEEINRYLIFFEERFKNVSYYKTDITNSNFDIIVTCGNYAYHLSSKEDLIRFVKLMRKEEYENQYFIGLNSNYYEISYEVIIAELYITLGPKLFTMNLMDVVNYLQNNEITIGETKLDFESINYERLYVMFTSFLHLEHLNRLRGLPSDAFTKGSKVINEYYE